MLNIYIQGACKNHLERERDLVVVQELCSLKWYSILYWPSSSQEFVGSTKADLSRALQCLRQCSDCLQNGEK